MIKSPFNFIPTPDRVYYPSWGEQVSQDIPFSDHRDGVLDVTIKAETPIFIRDTGVRTDVKEEHFCKAPDGRYFIPGSSLRGEIREVFSIISFGKMNVDKNMRLAQREWDNKDLFPLKGSAEGQRTIKGGWLIADEKGFRIKSAERIYRISMADIDSDIFGNDVLKKVYEGILSPGQNGKEKKNSPNGVNLNRSQRIPGIEGQLNPKLALFKYRLAESVGISYENLDSRRFDVGEQHSIHSLAVINPDGAKEGALVFTGQPDLAVWDIEKRREKVGGKPRRNLGKFYEFVFEKSEDPEFYEVSDDMFKQYSGIYADSDDWKFFKKYLYSSGIPVFFRVKDNVIQDFGLSFLYKLPYEKTPYDLESSRWGEGGRDLSEIVFGYADRNDSLRGRVQFSHLFAPADVQESQKITLTLGGPKATYYPLYIKQESGQPQQFKTYKDGVLSGWKRYVGRESTWERTGTENTDSSMYPLPTGTRFHGKISYHNLREVELGALLSAITFHGTQGCYHMLGQAKPYGFGRVSITIDGISKEEQDRLMSKFEMEMINAGFDWRSSPQIRNLLSMGSYIVRDSDRDKGSYEYMVLDVKGGNEFLDAKGGRNKKGPKSALTEFAVTHPVPQIGLDSKIVEKGIVKKETAEKEAIILRYDAAIAEGDALRNEGKLDEALASYDRAKAIYLDNIDIISDVHNARILETLSMKTTSEKRPLAGSLRDDMQGKTIGNIKTVLSRAGKYAPLSDDDLAFLHDKIMEFIGIANKKDKKEYLKPNFWKSLTSLMSEAQAQRLISEIMEALK